MGLEEVLSKEQDQTGMPAQQEPNKKKKDDQMQKTINYFTFCYFFNKIHAKNKTGL